jgi:uncharacterized sulfatase
MADKTTEEPNSRFWKNKLQPKLNNFFHDYVLKVFCLFFVFFIVRVLEYTFVTYNKISSISADLFFSKSLNFDVLVILLFSLTLLLPLFLISVFSFKLYSFSIKLLGTILVFINLALTQYFLTNNTLLTAQLFEFSFTDIKDIVFNEFSFNRLVFWIAVVLIMCLTVFVLFIKVFRFQKKTNSILLILYSALSIIALFNVKHTFKELKYFDSNYNYLLGNSKISYFIESYFRLKEKKADFNFFSKADLERNIFNYMSVRENFSFSDKEFPFSHNENYKNVLGNYFIKTNKKPNVVIIISESLSASTSGNHSLFGSLTPFTDSLMMSGLSWDYFFSNANRSFGALPNILASAPPSTNERGFINTKIEYPNHKKYPEHNTIINLLKQNGYITNYYYGGWGYFDNVGYYLKEKNIDNFICEENFNQLKYKKNNQSSTNQVWGYNDKELFKQAMDLFEKHTSHKPFLSVYQTISCHSPYNLSEKSYYEDNYLNKKLSSLGISNSVFQKIEKNIVSSIFFADDALKLFFNEFKSKPEFDNTIFIITGDHSFGLTSDNNAFKNFWVPLIVYSPLLTKKMVFKGVCSHVDILPSLLALLQENYGLSFPKEKQWIGSGLDTSKTFNAKNFFPLNLTAMDMPNFIAGNQTLFGKDVFTFDSTLTIFKTTNKNLYSKTMQSINSFSYLNSYVCIKNKIWKSN